MSTIAKWRLLGKRMPVAAVVAWMAALAVFPGTAAADTLTFPAGQACSFELRVDVTGAPQVNREFKNGRALLAGTGSQLTFTNTDNGTMLALRANGAVSQTVTNPDGTQTVTITGHNVLFLFPTDTPAGPSTTLIVGRVVFTVDAAGNFTVLSTSGTTTDICAALS